MGIQHDDNMKLDMFTKKVAKNDFKNDIRVSLKREKDLISNSCFFMFPYFGLYHNFVQGKRGQQKVKI